MMKAVSGKTAHKPKKAPILPGSRNVPPLGSMPRAIAKGAMHHTPSSMNSGKATGNSAPGERRERRRHASRATAGAPKVSRKIQRGCGGRTHCTRMSGTQYASAPHTVKLPKTLKRDMVRSNVGGDRHVPV